METKLFSLEMQRADSNIATTTQAERLVNFEKDINKFLVQNPEFNNITWLQSSGASEFGSFTVLTAVLKKD